MSEFQTWEDFLDSDVDGWSEHKLDDLFTERRERNRPTLPLLAVTGKYGVVERDFLEKRDTSNADKSKYLRVVSGDLVYNTMRMWQGVSGIAPKEGIVSPAYTVATPTEIMFSSYAGYLAKNEMLIQKFHQNSQGLVDDTLNLKFPNFGRILAKVPPLPEQKKIASILTSVDEVIEKTQSQIDKLQDLKKGTMNELLTKGIGHTEFKDSELGRIPKSWEVKRLAELVEPNSPICYGILMPGQHVEGGVPVVKVKDIYHGVINTNSLLLTDPKIDEKYKRSRIKTDDLLVTIRGTTGRTAIVPNKLEKANITQDTARIRIANKEVRNFTREALDAERLARRIQFLTIGQAVKGINLEEVRKLPIPLPSNVEELELINGMGQSLSQSIKVKLDALSKLQSLKKSLMQDLLTGKVRVSVN